MSAAPPLLRLWAGPELQAGSSLHVFAPERRHQLLTWLALQGGRWCRRDEAAALLWPGHDEAAARRNLRKVLVEARAVAGAEALEADDHALRWRVDTDLDRFEAALREQPPHLAAALALRRGPPLARLDMPANARWSEWLAAERGRIETRWQRAAHQRLAMLGSDDAERAALAQQLLALDPLDDLAMGAWLEGLLASGAQAAAQQAWRAYTERLAQELGIEPPARLRALLEPPRPAAPAPPAGTAAPAAMGDSFVGRRLELAELVALLAEPSVRLVTLTGPGGIGKSSLAAQLRQGLPAPAVLAVEMHDLDGSSALAARLAQRLGITLDDRHDTAPQIAAAWSGAPALPPPLLVLDNAEQIADLPPWLGRLQAAAPDLRLLVSSRTRLQLPGEQVLALQGLAVPDEDSHDVEAAPAFDAVRLFEQRATRALPGFVLAPVLPAVIEIVQRCGGLPLAIELAAAWVRLLPPAVIARELAESIDLLERDPAAANAPARPGHASMRVVFEHSLALLAPREREALEALAVFRGSFTRAAAQAVAGTALPLLASLVDKSLLATTEAGRFVLHPLLAALAGERLRAQPPQHLQLQGRHAQHLLRRLAESGGPAGADTRATDALLDAEEADLRQAWQHALAQRMGELVAPVLTVWAGFFDRRGRHRAGAALLRPALEWPGADAAADHVLARARAAVAGLWFMAREPRERVRELAAAGIEPARRSGDGLALARCLAVCAAADSELGRLDDARAGFEAALALANAEGQTATAVRCLRNLGSVAMLAGDYAAALANMRHAQQRARDAGLEHAEADALLAQAGPHVENEDWAAAEQVLRQALPMAKALGARQLQLAGQRTLGCALIELGRLDEARQVLRHARELGLALAQPAAVAYADTYLALAAARAGRLDEAEVALHAVAQRAREAGWHLEAMRTRLFLGEVLARRGDLAGAARAFQAVADDPALPAGERQTARRWAAALPARGGSAG